MKKGSDENRELAFMVYKAMEGKNIPAMIEKLSRYGLKVSAHTLHKWKKAGGWKGHINGVEKNLGLEEKMMQRLIRLIGRFDCQIEGRPLIDTQMAYAYTNLIRAVVGLSGKIPIKIDPEEMRLKAEEILEMEYGIKRTDGNS